LQQLTLGNNSVLPRFVKRHFVKRLFVKWLFVKQLFVKQLFVKQFFVKKPIGQKTSLSNNVLSNVPVRQKLHFSSIFCQKWFWQFWSWLTYFRPLFEVKIGVASWVGRGRRPHPAACRANPPGNPDFNTQKEVLVMRVVLTVGDERT
jgi:hypothetical protein